KQKVVKAIANKDVDTVLNNIFDEKDPLFR
ncbi:unnamed protein product, partial [marine sediment metagenome]